MIRTLLTCMTSVVLVAGSRMAAAQLIAHEDFGRYVAYEESIGGLAGRLIPNGLDGNPVAGQRPPLASVSGIRNWRGVNAWTANRAEANNLDCERLALSAGKRMLSDAGGTDLWAELDTSAAGVFGQAGLVAGGRIGTNGATLYFSFLFRQNATVTNAAQNYMALRLGTTNRVVFGQLWNAANFQLQAGNNTVLDTWNTRVHLVVMKVQFVAGADSLTLWYDPNPWRPEAAQTIDASRVRDMEFDNLYFKTQNNGGWTCDELRFGTSFAAVVPPAPSPGLYFGVH